MYACNVALLIDIIHGMFPLIDILQYTYILLLEGVKNKIVWNGGKNENWKKGPKTMERGKNGIMANEIEGEK